MSHPHTLVLHIWPGRWGLISVDPACLAAALYLQLTIPGEFSVAECTNPDLSPSGKLPFLTDGMHSVSPLASIMKFVSYRRLGESPSESADHRVNDLDAILNVHERAQKAAWCAHIESQLGDLLGHAMYAMQVNWRELVHPTFAMMLPVPQRYYVPGRLRDTYKSRLESSDLWDVSGEEVEEKPKFGEKKKEEPKEHQFKRVFQRDKIVEKARDILDIYARLLGDKSFFFHDRPTTLDIVLAAHILLLIEPPYPDPLLKSLVNESYPRLASHARSVYSAAFPVSESYPPLASSSQSSLRALLPSFSWSSVRPASAPKNTKEDSKIDLWTLGWIALATIGTIGFWAVAGPRITFVVAVDDEDEVNELDEAEDDAPENPPISDDEGGVS
ncbi:hypothetical protein GLOTRDRAFT_72674 [Gloeophyllum trabeum ATCC 11539]|uniref:Mitochondrial outer membrane transport complex Sam37/metaxin N-terminal domain-containing protein n=1 Tax=Gloeophyllum trabeum (strain ATCC 11539 / FP-39264 / Madison 617) TaxID=670483 RepID=S7RY56_GLOTA|nr:uncharacterized protein GLOTRDRAFT_72674 [Gloeophyllum trabeum ATCC 11539]EPQ58339.1 hypothetical protein GLOTRDRAFT_72674 [Gloeophyllum trabeum ATCC 11539]